MQFLKYRQWNEKKEAVELHYFVTA